MCSYGTLRPNFRGAKTAPAIVTGPRSPRFSIGTVALTGELPCGAEGVQHRTDGPGGLCILPPQRRLAPLQGYREPPGADPLWARHRRRERLKRTSRRNEGYDKLKNHSRLRSSECSSLKVARAISAVWEIVDVGKTYE